MGSKTDDLFSRLLINSLTVFFVGILIFFAKNFFFRWIFAIVVGLIAACALWEYYNLLKKKGLSPPLPLGILSIVSYLLVVFLNSQCSLIEEGPFLVLTLTFVAFFVFFALKGQEPLLNMTTSFWGILYVGIPLGLIFSIIYFPSGGFFDGIFWIIYGILVTKSADMGGYFIGRHLGKHKLALKLSPNKTLEGALGGLLISGVVSVAFCFLEKNMQILVSFQFSYFTAIWLGILLSFLGQLGDLAESLLKRDAHVKDSNIIPGVGGILDMVDSLLFTFPAVYIFLRTFYN